MSSTLLQKIRFGVPLEFHKATSASISTIQGELCENYKTICDREQMQADKNPGNKSAFADIAKLIQENCLKFTN